MKKAFLFLMICFSAFTYQAQAIGIEVSFERGIREWNEDQSQYACIGPKKTCKFTFKIDFSLAMFADVAPMPAGEGGVFNSNGALTVVMPISAITDPTWSQMFTGTFFELSADYHLTPQEQAALGANCPAIIPAGNYPYVIQNNVVVIAI
ncbi:MAG: hypothetical protein KDC07_12455 [Chitinophagaceae bacterium]|nr:hypothetical protein [Chitinophagaceae bacterium]